MKRWPAHGRSGRVSKILLGLVSVGFAIFLPAETQNAVANGDTRTIQLVHAHTKETITATFLVNGSYDRAVLDKLNWFLRDWRRDEPTKMDPRLFDVIWDVHRESGSQQPIEVMSAYRSPETNAMLRRRSRGVAEHSQHILGKAMDQHYYDVPMSKIREIAMRLQRGGVGFYPTAGTPFVHMDVGGVRHWPRMSYDQLARLFPDGKTVHIPSNGQPLPGYEMARAELEARGDGSYPTATEVKSKGFFAWLFGGGSDEEEDAAASNVASRSRTPARPTQVASTGRMPAGAPVAPLDTTSKSGGAYAFLQAEAMRNAATTGAQPVATRQPVPAAPAAPAPAPVAPDRDAEAKLAVAMSMRDGPQEQAVAPTVATTAGEARPVASPPPMLLTAVPSGPIVPMPPTRPVELADLEVAMPMPPVRPPELTKPIEPPAPTAQNAARVARADGISGLLAGSGSRVALPSVITQGDSHGRAPTAVLAYAAQAVPIPVPRPVDLVSARLDRSNFRSMTSAVKAEKVVPRSALGSSVVGIRAAARTNTGALASGSGVTTRFGMAANDLTSDRFSGQAPRAATVITTAKRVD